jgi:putative endonuclease
MSNHYIYIMTNKPHGTIYIGNTVDLVRRVAEHKGKIIEGYTERYNLTQLVYFEHFEDKWEAANRERLMKKWKREWKVKLIETSNPNWYDLYETIL